jgi:hypothetical protein
MSRSTLSLFTLDRPLLDAFSAELRAVLAEDAREPFIALLGLGGGFADRARAAKHAVDLFLVPETEASHAGIYASLRRVVKKRALTLAWTSPSPALEGRLRAYEPLREDAEAARRADALLESSRVPWFLRRPGGTAGWLNREDCDALREALSELEDPPPEISALAEALGELSGDVLCHDGLG